LALPKEPVVDDDSVGTLLPGTDKELLTGRYPGSQLADIGSPFDLEAVGTIVLADSRL
jgi:hypothetical protein